MVDGAPAGVPFGFAVYAGDLATETPGLAIDVDVLWRDKPVAVALGAVRRARRLDLDLLRLVAAPELKGYECFIHWQDGLATARRWEHGRAPDGRLEALGDTGLAPVVVTGAAVGVGVDEVTPAADAQPHFGFPGRVRHNWLLPLTRCNELGNVVERIFIIENGCTPPGPPSIGY